MALIPKPRIQRPDNLPVPAAPSMRPVAELEPERGYLSREVAELGTVNTLTGEESAVIWDNGRAWKAPLRYIVNLARQENAPASGGRIAGGGGRHTYERSVSRAPAGTPTAGDLFLAVRNGQSIQLDVSDISGGGGGGDAVSLGGQLPAYYTNIVARLGYTPLDSATYTAADILTKIKTVDGAGSGLDADLLDAQSGAYYLDRTNHTGTQIAATISDFPEAVDDRVSALVVNGTGISWSYNDGAGTLTGTVSLASFSTSDLGEGSRLYYTDERVDDRVAVLIQNGTGISWTYSDAGGTLTPAISLASFSTTNLSEGSNLYFTDERAQDAIGAALTDSSTIDFTYTDASNTITAIVIDDSISNTKLANMATQTIKGRNTASTGDPEDLAPSTVKTMLSLVKGDVGLGNVDNTSDTTKNAAAVALTNKDLSSGTNTFPTLNQNTTGSAAKWTTARTVDGQSLDGTANITVIAPGTNAATSKATPVDADQLPLVDSAASNVLKKLTWANLKATLNAVYDWATVAHAATGKTTPVDADELSIVDSAASNVIKKLTWANLKATLFSSPSLTTPSLGVATATTINGAAIDNNGWTTYTPTVTAGSGTFTTVSATGRHKRIGKTCFVQVYITITTNGTAATNVQASLPFTAVDSFVMAGKEKAISGAQVQGDIGAGGSTVIITKYDASYPGGTSAQIMLAGLYETT